MGALAKGGLAGLAGAVVSAGSQMLLVVVLARGLDAASAGVMFTTTSLCLMVAGILRLDAGNGLIYFIARTRGERYRDISRFLRPALTPVVVLSLVAAVLVYLGAGTVAGLVALTGPSPETVATILRTLALALPVIVCADVLVSATRGFGTMRPTTLLSGILQPAAQLVLVGAVVMTGAAAGRAWALPAAWSAPAFLVLLLAALWLGHRAPYTSRTTAKHRKGSTPDLQAGTTSPRVDAVPLRSTMPPTKGRGTLHLNTAPPSEDGAGRARGATSEFWRYTGPRAFGGAVQAVFQRLDVVVVALLAGPAEAAVYTAATRFKVVGQLVNQGLAQAAQPRLIRAMADGDLSVARRLYQTATIWLVVLTWPVWLGYALLAPWLLGLFGDGYGGGAGVAVVLGVTMMVATACGMVDVVLTAAGHTASSMANMLTAIMVTITLDVVLVPSHGALGAALGWSAGVLAKNLLPLFQISRTYGLRPFGPHSLPSLRLWRSGPPGRAPQNTTGARHLRLVHSTSTPPSSIPQEAETTS
ncbi:lipopolysaccharide biosynthesis protein [Sphaerisporangium sp. NPDC051011]|uniref:lipopolysaccharide biosynthesis protein n=1 Tax=Sphaerisporangium sp. NPDC051011 TaxID=3155792 RepID=UPI0033F64BE1